MVLAHIYRFIVALRNLAYDRRWLASRRLPGKVISIGNIAVGGTGKSPVVCRLAAYLRDRGDRPVILTRGYRSGLRRGDSGLLLDGAWQSVMMPVGDVHADEAMMQSRMLQDVPVVVGARRWHAAQRFLRVYAYQPTHWLLDDGFQHRQLARDLDLVLLDSRNPFAGGDVLPRGRLREPLINLVRADVVGFTRSDAEYPQPDDLALARQHAQRILFIPFRSGSPWPAGGKPTASATTSLPGAKVVVVAGIAQPERFIREVVNAGATIVERYIVGDHQRFSTQLILQKSQSATAIVTTAKDYWREPEVFATLTKPVFILPIMAEWPDNSIHELLQQFAL